MNANWFKSFLTLKSFSPTFVTQFAETHAFGLSMAYDTQSWENLHPFRDSNPVDV